MSYSDTASTNTNTTPTTRRIRDMTPEETAEAIKNVAKNIREGSYKMREAVRAIRQSGAIDELTEAVREATIAARDTAKEISETARDMRERGIIKETINAAEETNIAARETAQTVRETVSRTQQPQTATNQSQLTENIARKKKSETT
jgi:methyl-accepting chemotaxis protein